MLFNFSMDAQDRSVVLLVGLPQINNTLRLVSNEPIRQRITMNYNLSGLSREEIIDYIKGKLKGANSTMELFDPNGLEAIVNASLGVPRIINNICNASLMIGNSKKATIIDADIIMDAVNEIELD